MDGNTGLFELQVPIASFAAGYQAEEKTRPTEEKPLYQFNYEPRVSETGIVLL